MHLNPPFRAEHIGSLLRPPALLGKRALFEQKQLSIEELCAAEDEAIEHVVQLQRDVGMRTITDGELRRGMFFEGVFDNLEGMTMIPNRWFFYLFGALVPTPRFLKGPIQTFKVSAINPMIRIDDGLNVPWQRYIPHIGMMYASGVKEAESVFCTGKLKRIKPFYLDQFNKLKRFVPAEPTEQKLKNCMIKDAMEEAGIDHEALLNTYIRAINVCTQDRPGDLTPPMMQTNFQSQGVHFSKGSYDRIAAKLFNKLDVDTFYLEYDTDRAGNFAPLKHLPNNKVVVLGLVTTKNPKLETVEEVKARVAEAVHAMTSDNPERTRQVALNQLCISTQCGFASVWEGNPVTEEDERKKLAVLVEAAKQIWSHE
ncbi:hypothetical protein C0995_011818 [Termitomyces sp. Mi166|nr:hypothetical protein C0995_011818 [Termitomyces sp. Mi166\